MRTGFALEQIGSGPKRTGFVPKQTEFVWRPVHKARRGERKNSKPIMLRIKLSLNRISDQEVVDLARLIVDRMGENASIFPAPNPPLTTLTAKADLVASKLVSRAALMSQLQMLTIELREAVDDLKGALKAEAQHVEGRANGDASILAASGMGVGDVPGGSVGPMPRVEGLGAAQGEIDGEVDLQWNPVRRGLKTYEIELAPELVGPWSLCKTDSRSSTTVSGLVSGKRYWFRVRAVGAEGPGKPSEPVTRTAP